ncbi:flagellar biosynthesis protein FlgL [Sulfurimonas sp.]|uniref:flagellin N-terminal helical domain-containing protein n=1 Tax=Sulfurimonas sp. TaxID=2022749 RepID=UPI0035654F10
MRVTTNMYYKSLYGTNNSKLSESLFDVNKQIASGLKIQYAKDDVRTFAETMSLDNEISTLGQVKKSTQSGYKMSNQTDVILNEFETSMNRMRTLLLQAANGTNDATSLDAVAKELRGLEGHFKGLANSSINGQYLFSGTAVDIKPIADDGTYMGNDQSMKAFTGSKTQQQYNISGGDLFLGEEVLVNREVTSNVVNYNLIKKYPALGTTSDDVYISSSNTIRDMMGDTDNIIDTVNAKHHFYLRGTKSDGVAFEQKISMRDDEKVDELLTQIGVAFGNTPDLKIVNVTMNLSGQIVVEDKIKGSSKLDFHMVGAVDYTGGAAADVTSIDALGVGETNFDTIQVGPPTATNPNLYVKEFIKSSLTSATGVAATNVLEATVYDRTNFSKDGSKLSSSIPQILKDDNTFAKDSTKISEVADLSQLPSVGSLDGTQLKLTGTNVTGAAYDVQIDFATAGSTFSLDGGVTNYEIFNMASPRAAVAADDMSYRQLMDVVNMVVTNNLPATTNVATDYDSAINVSDFNGRTFLSYDGKIQFQEIGATDTKASIALHDANSGDFTTPPSVMTFNANNGLTVRDPKTDFFKTLDEMITAVENYTLHPDSTGADIRNIGIGNAIAMMDDLQDHVFRAHSLVGAQSNSLTSALERSELLEVSTMTLRSSVIDTDLAEASLTLTQLTLNYEAMLATVGKVSKLNLVNYL